MTDTITRTLTLMPGARTVRPRFPCCPQRQATLNVKSAIEYRYDVACPVCGQAWAISTAVSGETLTLAWQPAPQEEPMTAAPQDTTARAALAARIGEDVDRIVQRDAQWARYMQEGAHVRVTFRRWGATTKATLADLGLEPDLPRDEAETDTEYNARVRTAREATLRVLQLGRWNLLPLAYIRRFEAIDCRGRTNVEETGYRTHWGWWIHADRYAEWKARHEEIAVRYNALADEVYEKWEELQAGVRADLAAEGLRAYERARRSAAYRAGILSLPDTAEEFAQAFVARIMAQVPDRDAVRAKYGVEYAVELIPLAQQVAQDEARAQQIRLDAVTAQMAEDIRRTEAQKAAEGVRTFVEDVKAQIRAQVYDAAVEALDGLRKRKHRRVTAATAERLRALCAATQRAVFWEDPDLEAQLDGLRLATSLPDDANSPEEVEGALRSLGAEARIVLLELDRTGERRPRPDLGLTDDLGDLARAARRARAADGPEDARGLPDVAAMPPGATRGRGGGERAPVAAL